MISLPLKALRKSFGCLMVLLVMLPVPRTLAQADSGTLEEDIIYTYHKLTGRPFDVQTVAQSSRLVQSASGFDRPDVLKQEVERLNGRIESQDPAREYTLSINSYISDYDHDRGEFSINLFEPGAYVPLWYEVGYRNVQYHLVFANGAGIRAIRMPKDEARAFDGEIMRGGSRNVLVETKFRVTGAGDPTGAVSGQEVVRAELTGVRLLHGNGNELYTPVLAATPAAPKAPFDARALDVAGLRIGIDTDDFASALERLYGVPTRVGRDRDPKVNPRYAGYLELDLLRCMRLPGQRRREPQVGDICVRAFFDEHEVVRAVVIQRVFPRIQDAEVVRRSVVERYGEVSYTGSAGNYVIGWGPTVPQELLAYGAGGATALSVHVEGLFDLMGSSNGAAEALLVLQLVDAGWANGAL